MIFRAAILQQQPQKGLVKENLETVLSAVKSASERHADILLLPECFLTGYFFPVTNKDALETDCAEIQTVCRAAAEYSTGVVLTAFTKGYEKPGNSAIVIDKSGKISMSYSKVHTCDFSDEKCLESGSEFKVCDFHGIKLGIMICYDREYPESARVLMLKGAEIILVPNDCASMPPRLNALSTRAYENMTGIAMANPPGDNAGNSCAFSPICWDENGICTDNTLLMAGEKETGLFYADFDMESIRKYRETEMMGNTFRKVKAYTELMNPEILPPFIRKI